MKKKISFLILSTLCIFLYAEPLNGKRITVPKPTFINGSADEEWVPLFIQGQLTTNFQNYSGLTVIDRLNQDKAKAEQKLSESASYSEVDQLAVGKLVAANYIVAITVIKKGSSFSIDAKINAADTNTTVGKAYTNPNCSVTALESGAEINNLAYELLKGLGIPESQIKDLKDTTYLKHQKSALAANTNIAKGISSEMATGNIVQTLAYYQKASGFSEESTHRIQTMTTNL